MHCPEQYDVPVGQFHSHAPLTQDAWEPGGPEQPMVVQAQSRKSSAPTWEAPVPSLLAECVMPVMYRVAP